MKTIYNLLVGLFLLNFAIVSFAQSYESFRAAIPKPANSNYPSMNILIDLDDTTHPDFQITDVISQNTVADTVFEMEILNVQTKHDFLSKFIDTVFSYNIFNNSNYRNSYDYLLFYVAFLPSKAQPKVVWEEVTATSNTVKNCYSLSNYLAYKIETVQLGIFKHTDWPNRAYPFIVLKRQGKYYITKNSIFPSCHIVSNDVFYSPFQKGRKLNFYDRILKKQDLEIELKKRYAGGFSAYKPEYRETDAYISGQYFIENYDAQQKIFHFYQYLLPAYYCDTNTVVKIRTDKAKPSHLQSIDFPIYCGPRDFWANPDIGFLALDSPELQYDLNLKKPFEVKTVNGLPMEKYLQNIKTK